MPENHAEKPHILVVDDDDRLRELLRRYLADQGFLVTTANNAKDARHKLHHFGFDLIVLDIMMPGESGLDLTKSLRAPESDIAQKLPVLLLTARGEAGDRIAGLEVGADDYLPKPFEPRELLLRINAILRRVQKPQQTQAEVRLGKWLFDIARDELRAGKEQIGLTDMEGRLLRVLAAVPGEVVSREQLAERGKITVNDRTIDVQVTRLRRKIENDPKNPRYLITVRGEGYMLVPDNNA
ncbi:MAG: response regulator [Alphaproteobacteria bacterium]|nr:response regulator [Alphaproteobacteria bacterium]